MQIKNEESVIFYDAGKILDRLKSAAGIKTDKELAKILGIDPSAISQWRKRNSIGDWILIFKEFPNLDYNWLIKGKQEVVRIYDKPVIQLPDGSVIQERRAVYGTPLIKEIEEKASQLTDADRLRVLKIIEALLKVEEEIL